MTHRNLFCRLRRGAVAELASSHEGTSSRFVIRISLEVLDITDASMLYNEHSIPTDITVCPYGGCIHYVRDKELRFWRWKERHGRGTADRVP